MKLAICTMANANRSLLLAYIAYYHHYVPHKPHLNATEASEQRAHETGRERVPAVYFSLDQQEVVVGDDRPAWNGNSDLRFISRLRRR